MRTLTRDAQSKITAEMAINLLKEGNERFLSNLRVNRNLLQLVNDTAEEQFPFAVVLSCSDSRISNELIFDQGLGDIFSIRLAGNIASENAIGSMEYACKYLGARVIVVMGHTSCGAVKGACADFQLDHLNQLLDHIRLAIEHETETIENRNAENKTFVNNVARLNVFHNIEIILQTSNILRGLYEANEIGIVGAMYDIKTGLVSFYDSHELFPEIPAPVEVNAA